MEPYGLFYAKDSDVVCVFCFLELLLLFLTLELGLTSRGAWTEPRRGRWQQNPEAALAPPRALSHPCPPACTRSRPVSVDPDPRRA